MHNVDTVIIVWTIVNAIAVLFSGGMVLTRISNLRTLDGSTGNGDRAYRMFMARQDIRRSFVRLLTFVIGLVLGGSLAWIQAVAAHDRIGSYGQNWPYALVLMIVLGVINEAWDRWALYKLRSMYRYHNTEYRP